MASAYDFKKIGFLPEPRTYQPPGHVPQNFPQFVGLVKLRAQHVTRHVSTLFAGQIMTFLYVAGTVSHAARFLVVIDYGGRDKEATKKKERAK